MSYGFIRDHVAVFPVAILCEVLGVSRSGYYDWARRPESRQAAADRVLAAEIRATHADSRGRYGSPRVHAALRAQGRRVGRKRVARLMRGMGLSARRGRRFRCTTDSRHAFPVAPNLLDRDFTAATCDTDRRCHRLQLERLRKEPALSATLCHPYLQALQPIRGVRHSGTGPDAVASGLRQWASTATRYAPATATS